ncbi:MAG: 30S ribosomal protein S6 [Candidatus Moeniiplasma glomeromycotorum]|nr:30S ribosomal protein S6 [Candidatus Moeniiplasma glomeromycotorum]MCE8162534.1 30S ribosomal protein S6 [Candidatus Moeniiplasma glomeromycotorum]MCE8166540.1 30S ribosomal protein S6 [Candidatus Moeniiplasma glomeromycotorum]MCE8166989.1 30S ribosomal protein S6 [Candidatus Moeniiplasma glomeromycotorum]
MVNESISHYELLLVLNEKQKNESKYEKMLQEIAERVKIEKNEAKDWKTAYPLKQTTHISYSVITFSCSPTTIPDLVSKILKPYPRDFLNRYSLINLEREKSKSIPIPKPKKTKTNNIPARS